MTAPDYTFTRQRLFSGFDGKTCKICPEVATDGNGLALMTWGKLLLTGCDVFKGSFMAVSTDGGKTWGEPIAQKALADTYEGEFRVSHSSGIRYSRVNRRWFGLGQSALYKDDKHPYQKMVNGKPYLVPLYISVDAEKGVFTGYKPLPFPFPYAGALPFGQMVECENGDIIVPFYFRACDARGEKHSTDVGQCVTVRYAFDGDGLKVVSAGKPLAMPSLRRGLCEPSLVKFRGRYYLTIRSDERGYFAESEDGLAFSEPRPWTWADGKEIGNRNTQQHWLVGADSLYLAYTRECADNGHVFRNRAPIFMAKFDPSARCLVMETEMPLVPELGARLGNFCCSIANENESWLVTAEWMQSWGERIGICEKYGSDNSLWLVKVNFGMREGESPYRELVPMPQKVEVSNELFDSRSIGANISVRKAEIAEAPKNVADEAYSLTIAKNAVTIVAPTEKGVRYAKTTLAQLVKLAGEGMIAEGKIVDWPRLRWRGYMPDTARNYLDIKSFKAMIDMMAAYKLNLLHWHLTEHYGWRLESKLYPELHSEKAFLNRHPGKYYTQDEFREIVDYAWERGIATMPELDVPGHATAFRHAFGFENMDNPKATKIIEDLFRELCTLTSVEKMPFVHMGTDEVWNKKVEGATPESISRWAKTITDSGRMVVSWDPGQTYDASPRISMLWAGNEKSAYGDIPCFDADGMYIETFDPFELLPHGAYQKQFVGSTREANQWGAIFCGWHDGFVGEKYDMVFRNQQVFPSCVVFGDNFWSARDRDYRQYRYRLPLAGDPLLAKAEELERRVIAQRDKVLTDLKYPFHFVGQTKMRWRLTNEKGETIAKDIAQATISPRKSPLVPGNFTEVTNGTMIAETWIRSPKEQTVGAWIGFMGMDRDHGIVHNAPTPKKGEWNSFGAYAELNGERIPAPDWKRPGIERGAVLPWGPVPWWYEADEEPFTDQEYFMREPTPIVLKKGWNHVRLVAPCPGKKVSTHSRHWIMTFCPVGGTTDHPQEVPDLTYSCEPKF